MAEAVTYEMVLETINRIGIKQEETDRIIKETEKLIKETTQQMKETDKRMDKKYNELNKQLGFMNNRYGEVIEFIVKPNMLKKFQKLGFTFTKIYPEAEFRDEKDNKLTVIDLTLEDGDKIMLVEVKSKPSIEDVLDHVKRMEKVRSYADKRNEKRKYMGAIAGVVFNDNIKDFAHKNGFYVIEPSGKTFDICVPENPYSPREWLQKTLHRNAGFESRSD